MTIRIRTETIGTRLIGFLSTAALVAASAIHVLWATGSSWPETDRGALADLVVGTRPFPGAGPTALVAAALAAGAAVVGWRAGLVAIGDSRGRLCRYATVAVAAALLIRGAGGLVASAFELMEATDVYRTWDLRLYSPGCLIVGGAIAYLVYRTRGRPDQSPVNSGARRSMKAARPSRRSAES